MIRWTCKKFDDLDPHELYAILRLRNEVFVVEQNCVFQDADNNDQQSFHLMAHRDDQLVAYTRIIPPGLHYKEICIGRVITSPAARGEGLGRELMKRSIQQAIDLFGSYPIKIGAQLRLEKFYTSFGFQQSSPLYLEDGIEHIEMILS